MSVLLKALQQLETRSASSSAAAVPAPKFFPAAAASSQPRAADRLFSGGAESRRPLPWAAKSPSELTAASKAALPAAEFGGNVFGHAPSDDVAVGNAFSGTSAAIANAALPVRKEAQVRPMPIAADALLAALDTFEASEESTFWTEDLSLGRTMNLTPHAPPVARQLAVLPPPRSARPCSPAPHAAATAAPQITEGAPAAARLTPPPLPARGSVVVPLIQIPETLVPAAPSFAPATPDRGADAAVAPLADSSEPARSAIAPPEADSLTLNVGPPVSAKPALTPPPLPKRPGAATRINPPPRPERIATHVDVPSSQSPVPPPLSIFFGHESAIEVADEPEPAASSAAMELDEPSTLEFTTDEAPIFDEPSLAELAEHDRAALGERLAALRLEGLCQNIRYQVAAHAAPAILFLLPDEGLDLGCFWEELAEHFAQQTGQQPHLVRFDRAGQATEFGPPRDAGRSSPSQLFVGTAATALPACAQLPALAAVYLLLDLGQTTRRAIGRNLAELHRRGLQPAGCILFDSICE